MSRRDVDDHHFIGEDGAKLEPSAKGSDIPLQRGHVEIGFTFEPREIGLGDVASVDNFHLGFVPKLA